MKSFVLSALVVAASAVQMGGGPMAVGVTAPEPTTPNVNVVVTMPDQPYSHVVPTFPHPPSNRHMIGTLQLMDAKNKVGILLSEAMNAEDSANFDKMQEIKGEIEELKAHLDILNLAHNSHYEVTA